MVMSFTDTHDGTLFSHAWMPSSAGAYAGTCIFLIILAMIDRGLVALKSMLEEHWRNARLNRRYVLAANKSAESGFSDTDPDAKIVSLVTARGVKESVRIVQNVTDGPIPRLFSIDLPRAVLFLCIAGVSYLLTLAIMTMYVGYFCSVLVGAFAGERGVGQYIHWNEHVH